MKKNRKDRVLWNITNTAVVLVCISTITINLDSYIPLIVALVSMGWLALFSFANVGRYDVTEKDIAEAHKFARFFDENNRYWEDGRAYNLEFLLRQQTIANDVLRARGYLFLSDVYDMLDLEDSQEAHVVGWIYNPDKGIEFDISEIKETNVFKLDFNVNATLDDIFKAKEDAV